MKGFLLFSLAFLALAVNFSEARLGIFGGANVTIRDAPYLAAFLSNNILECGATILGPKCVMTTGK
jgi:secreted trypsin-like serine protease